MAGKAPIAKFKSGNVEAALWEGEYQGKVTYSVSVQKRYKQKSGEWKSTEFFSKTDLLSVAYAVTEAYRYLNNLKTEVVETQEDSGI